MRNSKNRDVRMPEKKFRFRSRTRIRRARVRIFISSYLITSNLVDVLLDLDIVMWVRDSVFVMSLFNGIMKILRLEF